MIIGAVIVAAGMSSRMKKFKPMLSIGESTIIKKVISTLKQAGSDYVVVVTGNNAHRIERHIANMDVICLYNERFADTQMFDSARIGLEYLKNKCDYILFTPADIPLFSLDSVRRLFDSTAEIACPSYNGVQGHPLLIESKLIPLILSYSGSGGLREAIKHSGKEVISVSVDDQGILLDADTPEDYDNILELERKLHK